MKNTHQCPKCASKEVYQVPLNKSLYGGTVGVGILASIPIHRYVCTGCGFTEEWVETQQELDTIRQYAQEKGWEKTPPDSQA